MFAVWMNHCWSQFARTTSSTLQGLRVRDMKRQDITSVDRLWISPCYHGMDLLPETARCGTLSDFSTELPKAQTSMFTLPCLAISQESLQKDFKFPMGFAKFSKVEYQGIWQSVYQTHIYSPTMCTSLTQHLLPFSYHSPLCLEIKSAYRTAKKPHGLVLK